MISGCLEWEDIANQLSYLQIVLLCIFWKPRVSYFMKFVEGVFHTFCFFFIFDTCSRFWLCKMVRGGKISIIDNCGMESSTHHEIYNSNIQFHHFYKTNQSQNSWEQKTEYFSSLFETETSDMDSKNMEVSFKKMKEVFWKHHLFYKNLSQNCNMCYGLIFKRRYKTILQRSVMIFPVFVIKFGRTFQNVREEYGKSQRGFCQ